MNRAQLRCVALVCACIYKQAGGWGVDSVIDTAIKFFSFLDKAERDER